MRIEFLPAAMAEVLEAAAYYEDLTDGLGDVFLDDLNRVSAVVSDHPQIGAPAEKEFRRILLAQFPYTVIYRIDSEVIRVVAVAHQRRRPGYWRDRVR